MAAPKTRVRRATLHLPASDVMPVTVRGYGFRAVCDCGWQSRALKNVSEARAESKAHNAWHAGVLPLSLAGPL